MSPGQHFAGGLEQSLTVLFADDELVDVADGAQDPVEALGSPFGAGEGKFHVAECARDARQVGDRMRLCFEAFRQARGDSDQVEGGHRPQKKGGNRVADQLTGKKPGQPGCADQRQQ